MRHLRLLAAIPLIGALLFVGAATASAQTSGPVVPLPGLGDGSGLPFIDAGFLCSSPSLEGTSNVGYEGTLQTTESFVLLWSPGTPWTFMGQNANFNVMKCLFLYPTDTVMGAPYTVRGFPCSFPGGPDGTHDFANSVILVRDTWALEICTGTAVEKLNQTITFTSTPPEFAFVGGSTSNVTASATSGLPVSLTIDASATSVCSISGSTVSYTGAGMCVIDGNQAGNATYNPAPQVQQSFLVEVVCFSKPASGNGLRPATFVAC